MYFFSAGIDIRRQNMTANVDPRPKLVKGWHLIFCLYLRFFGGSAMFYLNLCFVLLMSCFILLWFYVAIIMFYLFSLANNFIEIVETDITVGKQQ